MSAVKEQPGLFDDATSFDLQQGKQAKDLGIELAQISRSELLGFIQNCLVELAASRSSREVTADDAQYLLIRHGYHPSDLGNAAGSLFRDQCWEFTGRWQSSQRVSNHAHQNRIWRLR